MNLPPSLRLKEETEMPRASAKSTTVKTTSDNVTDKTMVDKNTPVDKTDKSNAIDEIKKENESLKTQINQLMSMVSELKAESENQKVSVTETGNMNADKDTAFSINDIADDVVDISESKMITVISLSDGAVYLHGDGKTFNFDRFGAKRKIVYRDLLGVIANDRNFIESGVVYICDKDVVRSNYLENAYHKFLTPDVISNILTFSVDEIARMVSNTTKPIQETIISLVVEKINNNEYVDMNKVVAIGNAVNPKCDIISLANTMRTKK